MKFIKMHGAGNDYIFFDCIESNFNFNPKELAPILCNRSKGIGADGIIFILKSSVADCMMDIYNSDGSRAAMCGNGVRCVAHYFVLKYKHKTRIVNVETLSGIKHVEIYKIKDNFATSSVEMGKSTDPIKKTVYFDCLNECLDFYFVDVGNPHAVCFLEARFYEKIAHIAGEMQRKFKDGINVEFIGVKKNNVINARVFERGSGETLACGTGATAIARTINFLKNETQGEYFVNFPGGTLKVIIDKTKTAKLVGESEISYFGESSIEKI